MSRPAAPAELSRQYDTAVFRPAGSLGARLVVLGCWAAMVLAGLWFVGQRGFWLPWRDDYGYVVKVVAGNQPLTPSWLWESYGDNRIPLAKTMSAALLPASGWDFRAGAFANVVALGAVAFASLWVAARIRGRPSCADAVFPLLLLSWSQWETLAWSILLPWVVAEVVLLSLLLLIASRRRYETPTMALLAAGVIAFLPVLGPSTLAYVPALAVWLGYLALHLWKKPTGQSRLLAVTVGVFLAIALALVVLYFAGFELEAFWHARVEQTSQDDSGAWLGALIRLASMALATDTVSYLSVAERSLPLWVYAGVLLLGYYASAAVLLCRAWWRLPADRLRAAGLLLLLAGSACLFLALDKVRGHGDGVFGVARYAGFAMTPLVCALYAWALYGPRRLARVLQTALCLAACALLPLNMECGWRATSQVCQVLQSFADDLNAGMPSYVLANHHCARVLVVSGDPGFDEILEEFLAQQLRGLRERGVPPFDGMAADPAAESLYLNADAPAATENVEWDGDGATGQDLSASLTFVLPRSQFVRAVRLQYRLENETLQSAAGRLVWQYGGEGEEQAAPLTLVPLYPHAIPRGRSRWIWVNARIDRLRIQPDNAPFVFRLEQLVLLTPRNSGRE